MSEREITRRTFLRLSAIAATGAIMAACAPAVQEAAPAEMEAAPAAPSGPEAPMLAEMVESGTLPPLEQRLPENPLVWDAKDVQILEPEEARYGGTLKLGHVKDIDMLAQVNYARLLSDRSEFVAHFAEGWEFADDSTSLTFFLRKGVRWSDGEPYTTADILWWWDHIVTSEFADSPQSLYNLDPGADELIAVDDYTLQIKFGKSKPLFLLESQGFAGGETSPIDRCAPHFVEKFHPAFNPISGKDPKEQFQEMFDALRLLPRYLEDPERPVLWPWRIVDYKEGQLVRLERNPYYWAVDRQGRQLPYTDHCENFLLGDADGETERLKFLAGETHYIRRTTTGADITLFKENEEKSQIDTLFYQRETNLGVGFNTAHVDPNWAEVLDQADFRRALSIAVDRNLILETVYGGFGEVGQGINESGKYDPEIDGKWIDYDPQKASDMLDAIGLDQRDAEGFRTFADGTKMTLIAYYVPGWPSGLGTDEVFEIITEQWSEVGVRSVPKGVTHPVRGERVKNRDFEVYILGWWGGTWLWDLIIGTGAHGFAPSNASWWRNRDKPEGERPGVEPTGTLRELFELEEICFTTTDEAERRDALRRQKMLLADQLFGMGFVQNGPKPIGASKKLRGVWGRFGTDEMLVINPDEGDTWFHQFWIDEG